MENRDNTKAISAVTEQFKLQTKLFDHVLEHINNGMSNDYLGETNVHIAWLA